MDNRDFGKQLLFFRLQTIDSRTGKPVTQQRLGELLGHELGRSAFTGAAVSDWERGKSRVNANDRFFLVSLVKILKQSGGIKTPGEANQLLEAGNFRALNQREMEKLFPGETGENDPPAPPRNPTNAHFLLASLNLVSPAEYQAMLEKAKLGPPPFWPRAAVSLIRRFTGSLTPLRMSRGFIWLWIAVLAKYLLSPSLDWNFQSVELVRSSMTLFAAGSILLPAFIGLMTGTKDNPYWIEQNMQGAAMLRLYVHQGAFVGFHVGYFLILLLTLTQILLGLGSPEWLDLIKVVFPILVAYAGAQLVPYNLWLAYRRLNLKDGGIFFVFVPLGPLWALFFLEFYDVLASPIVGALVTLTALTIMAAAEAVRGRRRNSSR